MKNSIKILFAVSIMLFALSFSTFGATKNNNETQSKRNVTKAQTQNKSDKGLTNTQIASLKLAQFKQAQLNYNLLRAKCLKLFQASNFDGACTAAKAALVIAGTAAALACGTANIPACIVATAAFYAATQLVKETCKGSGIEIEESNGRNRKLVKSKKTVLNLKHAT